MLGELEKKYPSLRGKILEPLAFETNPDYVSALGLLTAFFAGFLFHKAFYLEASIVILVSGYLDIMDGYIASKVGETARGDFLDHAFDRLADTAILIGLSFSPAISVELGFLTTVSVLLVSYLGTQAQAITGERLYSGLMGRSDRMIVLFISGSLMLLNSQFLYFGVVFVFILSIITFVQRFAEILKRLD